MTYSKLRDHVRDRIRRILEGLRVEMHYVFNSCGYEGEKYVSGVSLKIDHCEIAHDINIEDESLWWPQLKEEIADHLADGLFDDLLDSIKRIEKLEREKKQCPKCRGSGRMTRGHGQEWKCEHCNGKGQVE